MRKYIKKKKKKICFVANVAFVIRCVVLNNPKDIGSYIDFRSESFFFTKFLLDKFPGARLTCRLLSLSNATNQMMCIRH